MDSMAYTSDLIQTNHRQKIHSHKERKNRSDLDTYYRRWKKRKENYSYSLANQLKKTGSVVYFLLASSARACLTIVGHVLLQQSCFSRVRRVRCSRLGPNLQKEELIPQAVSLLRGDFSGELWTAYRPSILHEHLIENRQRYSRTLIMLAKLLVDFYEPGKVVVVPVVVCAWLRPNCSGRRNIAGVIAAIF